MKKELNDKEREVLGRISKAGPSGISITQLAADCFRSHGNIHPSKANSWVRNSLRRPVALGMVHKTARGHYALGPGSGQPIAPAPGRPRAQRAKAPSADKTKPRAPKRPVTPRLSVLQFGPIAAADIELGDLTVLAGPGSAAKSLLLQSLAIAADAPELVRALEEAGSSLDSEESVLDQLFGHGWHGVWKNGQTAVSLNGRKLSPAALFKLRKQKESQPARICFIPAQRALLLSDGWPAQLANLDSDTPAAAGRFSQELYQRLGNRSMSTSFAELDDQYRAMIDQTVLQGGKVERERQGTQDRLWLALDGDTRMPFMAWTAAQQHFTPLLLGLSHLLLSKTPDKLESLDWVIVEEPDLGLNPEGVAAFMLLVLDLLWRGYKVVLSTHSSEVLEIVRALQSGSAAWQPLAEALGASHPEAVQKVILHAQGCSYRVYVFDRDETTNRVTARALGA